MPTRAAAPNVASERRRTAGLDRRHHATLRTIEMAGIGLAIDLTVAAEDIRHLEHWTSHADWPVLARRSALLLRSHLQHRERQMLERTLHCGDGSGGDVDVADRRG